MTLRNNQETVMQILQNSSDGRISTLKEATTSLYPETQSDPSISQLKEYRQVSNMIKHLVNGGLLIRTKPGAFRISDLGLDLIDQDPRDFSIRSLGSYASWKADYDKAFSIIGRVFDFLFSKYGFRWGKKKWFGLGFDNMGVDLVSDECVVMISRDRGHYDIDLHSTSTDTRRIDIGSLMSYLGKPIDWDVYRNRFRNMKVEGEGRLEFYKYVLEKHIEDITHFFTTNRQEQYFREYYKDYHVVSVEEYHRDPDILNKHKKILLKRK